MTIKGKDFDLSYLASLRSHLRAKRSGGSVAPTDLGRKAPDSGVETLGLARSHERALVSTASSHEFSESKASMLGRAGSFFSDAIVPIERDHRTNRESFDYFKAKAATLLVHTASLAAGNRRLEREVRRRKAGEEAVRKVKERYLELYQHSQFMQKKLRSLARKIITAQEDERKQISRELHDEVVQTLVGINVELAALSKGSSLGISALRAKITRTQRLVEKSVTAVHDFARELRPAALDDLGLIPALKLFMKNLAARKKFKIHMVAFAGVEKLSSDKRIALYRTAQESLTNVGRHAQASLVNVTISEVPGAVRMEVHDNGKSFQVLQRLSSKTNNRLGLLGMRERIEMVGGILTIESALGFGTTVRAEVPLMGKGGS
jgi:two-component system sensor histidine kinase DegS